MVRAAWRGNRERLMAPETPNDRFLQAICRLLEGVRDVVSLRNGFWDIRGR